MPGPFTTPVAPSVPFDSSIADPPASPAFSSDNVLDAIIEARNFAPGTASRFAVVMGRNGNVSNKWLQMFDSIDSNVTPFVAAETAQVIALSVAVNGNTTCRFGVYKNGVQFDDLTLDEESTNFKLLVTPESLVGGDELSVKLQNKNASDPVFSIFIKTL